MMPFIIIKTTTMLFHLASKSCRLLKPSCYLSSLGCKPSSSRDCHDVVDIAVVGGGIVGAASALEIKKRHPGLQVLILEKESELAFHQSGHNSGVLHAGIYYKPGSLKAKLCVKGMQMAYAYCDKNNIPYKKVGKLIVAVNQSEVASLEDLFIRGQQNGVPDLKMVDADGMREIEPFCKGVRAIWSPHTGIVDWGLVTREYGSDFQRHGGHVRLNAEVTGFREAEAGADHPLLVECKGQSPVRARFVLTCGGLHADRLAALSGCPAEPRVVPFRGEYLLLRPEKAHLVRGNIYPVPNPRFPFLGVHFTPRMDGAIWLGPNAVLAAKREGYRWADVSFRDLAESLRYRGFRKIALRNLGYGTGEIMRSIFIRLQLARLRQYVPDITAADITRGPAGVRAQALDADGNLVDDFVFDSGETGVWRRLLHVRNAPSPAATSSLAIAELIADRAQQQFQLS
ncbi:L-2-hydroxyglutarate dehydrogenase, mitochondrial-like isoform X2 [Pollicipes pollicipes]|uniref:L-2-hydroxyglutarate dehydrogenase, mitochondrial-like isoform X2 n=1 Tax=Pollicipes pollicipes TaxID=41117 RepID=UPI00188593C9|nr:L-2-hydroxyglutarate dehydrogenase, mitochondrial-like isoform X2 [Pollicipes pollicipes]